jgi:hypothetical protein
MEKLSPSLKTKGIFLKTIRLSVTLPMLDINRKNATSQSFRSLFNHFLSNTL